MGQYRIVIDGVGMHHNNGAADDADQQAKAFVAQLQKSGHSLTHARFSMRSGDVELAKSETNTMNVDLLAPADQDPVEKAE